MMRVIFRAVAAVMLVLSATAVAQGSGGGQGIAVQFQVVASVPGTCPTAGIVFEVASAGTYTFYNCPTQGVAPVQFNGGGGGGGVTSIQYDSNTAMTGAVQQVSGAGLSSAQAGQVATLTVNQASTSLFGGLVLGGDLGGAYNSQQVLKLHFGPTAFTLNPTTAPTLNQCLTYDGTYISGKDCPGATAPLVLTSPVSTDVPLTLIGAAGQTADMLNIGANGSIFNVSAFGAVGSESGIWASSVNDYTIFSDPGGLTAGVVSDGSGNGGGFYALGISNSATTGTVLNHLAKLSSTGAIITSTSDTTGAIGIVMGAAGTSGSPKVTMMGVALCQFDSSTPTMGDWVQISTATAGDCADAGSSKPASGEIIGHVASTGAAGSLQHVLVQISW